MTSHVDLPVWFFPLILGAIILAICVNCHSPRQSSFCSYAQMNFAGELNAALARGDKVRKIPRGDWWVDWAKKGEVFDFRRWHYEIVPKL